MENELNVVMSGMQRACDLIAKDANQETCKGIVNENFLEIFKMLESKMDSDVFCSKMLICGSELNFEDLIAPATTDGPVEQIAQQQHSRAIVIEAEIVFNDKQFYEDFDESMENMDKSTDDCKICLKIAGIAKKNAGKPKEEIKKKMEKLCKSNKKDSAACLAFVAKNADQIISQIEQKINPKKACHKLAVCISVDKEPEEIEFEDKKTDKISNFDLTDKKDDQSCKMCIKLAKTAKKLVGKKTDEQVEQRMHNKCKRMKTQAEECNKFVNENGKQIISRLGQKIEPKKICKQLSACSTVEIENYDESNEDEEDEEPNVTGKRCYVCQGIVKSIKLIAKSESAKDVIRERAEESCNKMKTFSDLCTQFIEKYFDKIMELIAERKETKEICEKLTLCSSLSYFDDEVSINHSTEVDRFDLPTPRCIICTAVTEAARNLYLANRSKDQIRGDLKQTCWAILPLKAQCEQFINDNSNKIVDLLAAKKTPKIICIIMGCCFIIKDSVSPALQIKSDIAADDDIKYQPECVICEFVMKKLENDLSDKSDKEAIINTVKNICHVMPHSVAKSCKSFIDNYFDMIVLMIQTMKPSEICAEMKLCSEVTIADDESFNFVIKGF